MFINNKSIFVHMDSKNKNAFQMFGKKYRASVLMEIWCFILSIDFIKHTQRIFFELTQIYGNIKFVLWSESTEIAGNPSIKLDEVKTNDVFKAWNEYMDFERRLYEDDLKDNGLIKYDQIKVNGDELIFELSESLNEKKCK